MKRLIAVRLPNLPYNPGEQSFRIGEARMAIAAVIAGLRGADGSTGPQGPAGATGPAGAQGEQGPAGPAGDTGPQGIQGIQGPQGIQGESGPVGAQGPAGPMGPMGPQGVQGPQGEQGPHGAPFRIAQTYASVAALTSDTSRDDGDFGLVVSDEMDPDNGKLFCFASGSWSFIVDMAGQPGIQGPTGPQGPAGPQGDPGPQGIQGPTGATGPQGIQGPTGATGATGATGPAGPGVAAGGTAGQVLSKIDGTDYNTQWVTPSGGTGRPKIGSKYYPAGRWYDASYTQHQHASVAFPQAMTRGYQYFVPFFVFETVTIDQLGIYSNAVSGGTVQLGIYASDANNNPGAAIVRTSAMSTTGAGAKTEAVSVTLQPNTVYWIAFVALGSNGSVVGFTQGLSFITGASGVTSATGQTNFGVAYINDSTQGGFAPSGAALPASAPAISGYMTIHAGVVPRVMFRSA